MYFNMKLVTFQLDTVNDGLKRSGLTAVQYIHSDHVLFIIPYHSLTSASTFWPPPHCRTVKTSTTFNTVHIS